MRAEDRAVRRVRYVKPIKRQLIGPDRALCVERYESSGPPDAGWAVDVRVKTPEVLSAPPHASRLRGYSSLGLVGVQEPEGCAHSEHKLPAVEWSQCMGRGLYGATWQLQVWRLPLGAV